MNREIKIVCFLVVGSLFSACVPVPKPHVPIGLGSMHQEEIEINVVKVPSVTPPLVAVVDKEYGTKPLNYMNSIRSYFSNKIARGELSKYKYGYPKRAYKKEGFAYGGDVSWKGWLVETSVATPTRTGRLLTPKPYMVLFSGEQIVEHILGYSHKLITKVDK